MRLVKYLAKIYPFAAFLLFAGLCSSGFANESISSYLREQEQKNMKGSPRTLQRMDRGDPLTISDVLHLHKNEIEDQTILRYLRNRKTIYQLNMTQIRRLRTAGIGEELIEYMTSEH